MAERMDISQARGNLSDLTRRAADGEEIILTRYGKDIARITPLAAPAVQLDAVGPLRSAGQGKASTGRYDQAAVDQLLGSVNRKKRPGKGS